MPGAHPTHPLVLAIRPPVLPLRSSSVSRQPAPSLLAWALRVIRTLASHVLQDAQPHASALWAGRHYPAHIRHRQQHHQRVSPSQPRWGGGGAGGRRRYECPASAYAARFRLPGLLGREPFVLLTQVASRPHIISLFFLGTGTPGSITSK